MKSTLVPLLLSASMFGCLAETGTFTANEGADAGEVQTDCAESKKVTYYADTDGDGYGDALAAVESCTAPAGYATNSEDCNDTARTVYPGALEVCGDKLDNNCGVSSDACMPNLHAQWSFNDPAGIAASDSSNNGHIGVLQGGLLNTGVSMLVFDGIDDFVEVPHTIDLELAVGSVAFWFMPSQIGIEQSMLSKDSDGNDAGGHLSFYQEAAGGIRVRLQSNNEDYDIVALSPLAANEWHHVAFSFGGNEGMSLTINGVLVGVDPYTGGLQRNLEPLVIGAGTDNSGNEAAEPISDPFTGAIADVQLYDRQLLLQEILELASVTDPLRAP